MADGYFHGISKYKYFLEQLLKSTGSYLNKNKLQSVIYKPYSWPGDVPLWYTYRMYAITPTPLWQKEHHKKR